MNTKHTFLSLCKSYDKIEVPIIQRDYAQGRETNEVISLREKFINDFLLESLISGTPIELDFVYGSILTEDKDEMKKKVFIPLDGQQRITTLFLLHYFIAVKEGKLEQIKNSLAKFTYETRPSSYDFCQKLLLFTIPMKLENIKAEIIDSVWFSEDWKKDPTVSGMLTMLDTFAKNKELLKVEDGLLERLQKEDQKLISFYFTDLDRFGLTENLYIRMNARGKLLTDFENFKSEFFKIINYAPDLLEDVKNKIEYDWVEHLWDYRTKDSFIIDEPFMNFLNFITQMLYFKGAEKGLGSAKSYATDFLDFKMLKQIYSQTENLKFLIFALDNVQTLKDFSGFIYWENFSLQDIQEQIISGKEDTSWFFILYAAIAHLYEGKSKDNLMNFVRVIRNLIVNTNDKSVREWPYLLDSVSKLISDENIYTVLGNNFKERINVRGFYNPQIEEEIFKARLLSDFPEYAKEIFSMEDHLYLQGNITNLLLSVFTDSEFHSIELDLENLVFDKVKMHSLLKIFDSYKILAKNNFTSVQGDLLISEVYVHDFDYSRVIRSSNYQKELPIFIFSKRFAEHKDELLPVEYFMKIQKEFVLNLHKVYPDFSEIQNPKEQLYLYYIIHKRFYKTEASFFKNNNHNFGWLKKDIGYTSLFTKGIENCRYFPSINPIFQIYNAQFRYSLGINKANTLDQEIVETKRIRNPFGKLVEWASN